MATDNDNDNDNDVIGLLSGDEGENTVQKPVSTETPTTIAAAGIHNPYRSQKKRASSESNTAIHPLKQLKTVPKDRQLQGGLVLEEDIGASCDDHSSITRHMQEQNEIRRKGGLPEILYYHDPDFTATLGSIDGAHKQIVAGQNPKCRCSKPSKLSCKQRGPNKDKLYFACGSQQCNFFKWANPAMRWYRFGQHNGHQMVAPTGFRAHDLVQGKVGDCWFLSALAVIAERPDLILRLFQQQYTSSRDIGGGESGGFVTNNEFGIVQVNLFVDGVWKSIVMDNFLPCIIDGKGEDELQQAIQASLGKKDIVPISSNDDQKSSKFDPHAMSDDSLQALRDAAEYLEHSRDKSRPKTSQQLSIFPKPINRVITSNDLAYSKAQYQQLWVPFLEKAYAKIHGSYHAISGGHIAEAFLDLTGAPTLQIGLLNEPGFCPRSFWGQLLSWREQRLPMGCGTNSSAAGIIGRHAYSILDVREIRNVRWDFFQDQLLSGSLGNVSGFTEFDGRVRLLRIRNPHGKGEWNGEFSDKSSVWQKLLASSADDDVQGLERTMQNDGTFWIDYDNFLMGFSNVDVVLAFLGNHAKSFESNFPEKKSNHRCTRTL